MHAMISRFAQEQPAVVWGVFTFLVWWGQALIRRYVPALWRWPGLLPVRDSLLEAIPDELEKRLAPVVKVAWTAWQALPSLLAGAMFEAYLNGGDIGAAWKGAAITALAPVIHHLRKALPAGIDAYRGELGPRKPYLSNPGGQS